MKDYTYSVARIRAMEASLMSRQDIEQLISSSDYSGAERLLKDKGVGLSENELWQQLDGIADEEITRVLKLPIDYHNIKASVKSVFSDTPAEDLLKDFGTTDKNLIYDAAKSREYSLLEQDLADTAEQAMKLLLRTHDGQLCDLFVDNAGLSALEKAAAETDDEFIKSYATLIADTANLRTAFRCAIMGKNRSFIENALYDGGSLNSDMIASAAEGGTDSFYEYVNSTAYSDGAQYIKESPYLFEKWCDDRITEFIATAKFDCFSAAPIIAYAYAKRMELKTVRLILSAKQSGLDSNIIRERVRRLYE